MIVSEYELNKLDNDEKIIIDGIRNILDRYLGCKYIIDAYNTYTKRLTIELTKGEIEPYSLFELKSALNSINCTKIEGTIDGTLLLVFQLAPECFEELNRIWEIAELFSKLMYQEAEVKSIREIQSQLYAVRTNSMLTDHDLSIIKRELDLTRIHIFAYDEDCIELQLYFKRSKTDNGGSCE